MSERIEVYWIELDNGCKIQIKNKEGKTIIKKLAYYNDESELAKYKKWLQEWLQQHNNEDDKITLDQVHKEIILKDGTVKKYQEIPNP